MTREELAQMLESEAHNMIAEHIRAGADPARELADTSGAGLRKALRKMRYHDSISRNAQAAFQAIVDGELEVTDA